MTLYDFNRCKLLQRKALVWQHCLFLNHRHLGGWNICFYHLDNFFVEVFYQVEVNHIELVIAINSFERLEPYLDKVDLSRILPEKPA